MSTSSVAMVLVLNKLYESRAAQIPKQAHRRSNIGGQIVGEVQFSISNFWSFPSKLYATFRDILALKVVHGT